MAPRRRVFSAGSNAYGQLANETFEDSHTFQPCIFAVDDNAYSSQLPGDRVISLAAGANHTLLLLEHYSTSVDRQREVWGCGNGSNGQLGPRYSPDDQKTPRSSVFRRIDRDILDASGVDRKEYTIHAIAASWESSYIVLRPKQSLPCGKDIVLSLGSNDYGDLGIGALPSKSKTSHGPHRVALETVFKRSHKEALLGFHVLDIAAGPHHVITTVHVFFEGEEEDMAIGWGACRHGELGIDLHPTGSSKHRSMTTPCPIVTHSGAHMGPVTSFALGNQHTVLLYRSGRVTGLGSNKKGQLTSLYHELGITRVRCTWNGTYLVHEDDVSDLWSTKAGKWEIRSIGSRDKGQLGHDPVASSLTSGSQIVHFPFDHTTHHLVDIACGSEHILALFVRLDTNASYVKPTEVWGWGWNEHGNLGLGQTADVHLPTLVWPPPTNEITGTNILGIWAGCGTSWLFEVHEDEGVERPP